MIRYVTSRPPGYHNNFEGYLYNQSAFLSLKNEEIHSFYAVNDVKKTVIAQAHFIICSNSNPESYHAISLPRSPFGSVEFSQYLEEEVLFHFISFIKESLLKQQVMSIQIKECIAAYRTYGSALLLHILHQQHFVIQEVIPNHHIVVDTFPFEKKIHYMELRRLRKCIKLGFNFHQKSLNDIVYFYQFIQLCRQEKGWALSIGLDEVKKAAMALQKHYKIFAVYDQGICVAACLAVLVNERILYNFFPASLQEYSRYSPIVFLLEGIYRYCQCEGIQILDLGTSASLSLETFKSHVGGKNSAKFTLYCALR